MKTAGNSDDAAAEGEDEELVSVKVVESDDKLHWSVLDKK